MNDDTLREQIGQVHSGKHPVSWMLEPEAIDEIMQLIAARDNEIRLAELENILNDRYVHPSGRHIGAVRYYVIRSKELKTNQQTGEK